MKRIYSQKEDTTKIDPEFELTLRTLLDQGRFNEAVRAAALEFDLDGWKVNNWVIQFAEDRNIPLDKEASGRKVIIEAKKGKKSPAWQRQEGKSNKGGLNEKGRKSYEKANPGSDLKPPVTEDKPKGKRKKRQDSYCARSKGQMEDHNINCRKTPDKPICKSRRRWNC